MNAITRVGKPGNSRACSCVSSLAAIFSIVLLGSTDLAAESGPVTNPAGVKAATPISIPRPELTPMQGNATNPAGSRAATPISIPRPELTPLQSNKDFCEKYAARAVEQFKLAAANRLPGLVPPIWSGDPRSHLTWCLGASTEQATQNAALRQKHVDRYLNEHRGSPQAQTSPLSTEGNTLLRPDGSRLLRPIPRKEFDPGRGP